MPSPAPDAPRPVTPPLPVAIPSRAESLAALGSHRFDVLVVGGGITGCGIARDAALRGLKVALVEKDDFASGTSSRSSRLVHGGVRYLEHGHLRLVFESSAERRRLLRLAPHLVRPLAFTWPVYAGARIPRWKLGAGLTLYDLLSLFRNVAPHRALSPDGVLGAEPALRRDGLRGGARYYDAATDDSRLTLANALGAARAGAVVVNHAEVHEVLRDGGRASGARVVDVLDGRTIDVHAKVVVNATGPWSDTFRRRSGGAAAAGVRGSKGVHVAVPRERIGNRSALTLVSPSDGRVMFVLPAGPLAIVGTTDTYTTASPDDVRASAEDVRYLLASANAFFPDARLVEADVVSAWAGIRPLVSSEAGPGAASREHAIVTGDDGVVSITGGKLTTYRIMAAQTVDAVERALQLRPRKVPTRELPLPGGDIPSLAGEIAAAHRETGDGALAQHLVERYGSAWRAVWEAIAREGREALVPGLAYTMGELRWCARHEMAETLGDLLIRRTHVAFETRDHGRSVAAAVARAVGWDAERGVADYEREVEALFAIDDA